MLNPEYPGRNGSWPWLLMSRLLAPPGHQLPLYGISEIAGYLFSTKMHSNYMSSFGEKKMVLKIQRCLGFLIWILGSSPISISFLCKWRWARNVGDMELFHNIQYIPRNMHTDFALLCFVVVIHWLIFRYPSGLLHWHCGNLTVAPVPAKQPWWIWINTSCEFIMNDCITTTKQSTKKTCAYFLGYSVASVGSRP